MRFKEKCVKAFKKFITIKKLLMNKGRNPSTEQTEIVNIQSEIKDLRNQLDSNDPNARKTAAKRVVQIMRSGENVGELFSDMLRCVKTQDIELKRLIYLYLVTYSLQESEQSIMVVNTIIQDSKDSNPLIRALATRTMCRIHIEGVAENMIIPLKERLDDSDPYVRKTAALGVAKLYDTVPEAIDNCNIYPKLIELLNDSNPLVVSNAAAAIMEINSKRSDPIVKFTPSNISAISNAIISSSEWCQIILFDAIAKYEPTDSDEAATMIDRLTPLLKNANPAVVIGAFKSIFVMMDYDERLPQDIFPTIIPPLLTLVTTSEPEIQYVVLRTLTLFVHKYPHSLQNEIRLFFIKYNDPSYVKMQKLEILTSNCTPRNGTALLDELIEYCNDVDVQFVKKAVKAIGDISLKLEPFARRCVEILITIVEGKAEYSVEQAIIVICDILRRYPGQFESIIEKVCNNVEQLKDPQSRASLIWILGEYNQLIDKVDIILDPFLDSFQDEQPVVQLQLISTIVKVYLDNPENTQDQLQYILQEATKESVLPDIRNKALIYWRMLSIDSNHQLAKEFILFHKSQTEDSAATFSPEILDELICNMGMVSGVLHVLPSKFRNRTINVEEEEEGDKLRQWKPVSIKDSGNSPIAINSDWDSRHYYLQVTNKTDMALTNFAIAVNVNKLGLELIEPITFPKELPPAETFEVSIGFLFNSGKVKPDGSFTLDFALRLNQSNVLFFNDFIDFRRITISPPKKIKKTEYLEKYAELSQSVSFNLPDATIATNHDLQLRNVNVVAKNEHEVCISFMLQPDYLYIGDLEFNENGVTGLVKGDPKYFAFIQESARYAFCLD